MYGKRFGHRLLRIEEKWKLMNGPKSVNIGGKVEL